MSLMRFFGLSTPGPLDNFWYGPVVRKTAAGIDVSESTATTYSGSWAATMLLSTSGAMLPLKTMEILSNGGSDVAKDHHTYSLVHDAPNDEMSSVMFRASRIAFQVNWGNGFGEIVRNRGGQPVALYPIHSSRIPRLNYKRGADGKVYYLVNNDDGSRTPVLASDMLHFPSPMSEDGVWGIGVVEKARNAIAYGLATELQGASYVANGAQPGVAIKNGKFRTPEDREDFRRQWTQVHGGPGNSGKPYLLPIDAEIQVLSFNPEQSQFIETRQHNIEEIARWYGVPQHLIQHLLRSTNNNIEQQSLEFVKFSLMRWLVVIEQELNRKLLTKDEQKRYFFKHNVDALERADITTRTTALAQQFFNGEITINEWRSLEDRKPIGPIGDKHFIQTAMAPLDVVAEGQQEPPPPVADDEPTQDNGLSATHDAIAQLTATVSALTASVQSGLDAQRQQLESVAASVEKLEGDLDGSINRTVDSIEGIRLGQQLAANAMLRDVMARLLSVEVNKLKREAEKPSRFPDRVHEFYATHTATLQRELFAPVSVVLAAQGSDRQPAEVVATLASAHVAESLRQLEPLQACKLDEFAAKLETCVAKWHEERSTLNVEAEYAHA